MPRSRRITRAALPTRPRARRVHELIDHRARSFQYIRRVHAGQKHWLGTVAFATDDLAQPRLYDSSQVRAIAAHAARMPHIAKRRAALFLRRHSRPVSLSSRGGSTSA